ncbi:hypothetical protein MMC09_006686 [Bachmanniomyces sp. S44760]|nr:hypothetical protein [Bachmanniomyces sp. S44760]
MASTHSSLDAAATERKARLAKLKSLKRKQPDSYTETEGERQGETPTEPQDKEPSVTNTYLSGRNYDTSTRGPKLGFESAPSENQETLEIRAKEISDATNKLAAEEEKEEKPIDLFKLQPKKPNWDLKRDVARKMERLNVQTENAIARLVRERIEGQKSKQLQSRGANGGSLEVEEGGAGEGQAVGMKGEELVEGVHVREREEEEEERREREDDEDV